jgi:hypothetical protein
MDKPAKLKLMKKFYLFIATAFLLPLLIYATTYNTIAIDGSNSGWAADETFDDISHDGYTGVKHAYFTWDAEYIYVAVADSEADYNNMATFIYFDTDPSGSNGNTNAYAWNDFINVGFKADFVVVWKNNYNDDYIEVRHYNDGTSNWDYVTSNTATYIYDGVDTLVKFAVYEDSNYREVKIKRSLIGNPDAIKTSMFTEQQWESSGNYRYMTWPSEGWTDAFRTAGQTIPNYYGFLLEENYSLDSSEYYNAAFSKWTGSSGSNWNDAANWDNGIPVDTTLVVIPSNSVVNINSSEQNAFDLSIKSGSVLTVTPDNSLTVNGGLFNHAGATGLILNSTNPSTGGNGSLIVKGFANDSVTAQCYVTASKWHSFATPVEGQTTANLFLNHNPDVWLLHYNEDTNNYNYISSLTQDLGDMQGWMLWLGGSTDYVFNFAGTLRTGTIGSDNNMIRSSDTTGYNFVGNPFTSAIDWDAASGWTKTNLNNAIYVYNPDGASNHWATYINGVGVNGGSRYIAMNQGFFVQVSDGGGAYPEYGTLKMTNDVCVHNTVQFFKHSNNTGEIIRLQVLTQDSLCDETVIRVHPEATAGFDAQWDAHKLFSFSDNGIAIFSTANNKMSINSVPPGTESIPIDFSAPNATQMTVSLTEAGDFEHVFLTDLSENITVDLKREPYTFIYRNYIHNRFFIHFVITDVNKTESLSSIDIFASHNKINVINKTGKNIEIMVYNILGQQIKYLQTGKNFSQITVEKNRYYIVKTNTEKEQVVKKVFVY